MSDGSADVCSSDLAWGWRALSPKWGVLWTQSPAALPDDYDEPDMDKIVVMMTDGENQFHKMSTSPKGSDFSAYGRLEDFGYSDLSAGKAEVDRRMAETCEAMKAAGIELYTVTFGPEIGRAHV